VVCSRATVEGQPSLGLGPLGGAPNRQRQGIGQALVHAVLAAADALAAPAVSAWATPTRAVTAYCLDPRTASTQRRCSSPDLATHGCSR
jgi:GNAT superfamily N-acetyltransferase